MLRLLRTGNWNLMLGETSADSPSLLGAQIQRHVFFLAISFPQTGLLRLTDDGQNLGDGQPHHLDLRELVGGTACHLSYSQKSQLRFQLLQLHNCNNTSKAQFTLLREQHFAGWQKELSMQCNSCRPTLLRLRAQKQITSESKRIPHVGSHHNPKEHTDLAIRSAQTQKINNISKKVPRKIHNRSNKTRMSAAMTGTHKASDHQQGLHKTKKSTRSLGKPRTWLRSSVLLLDRSSWTLNLAMMRSYYRASVR